MRTLGWIERGNCERDGSSRRVTIRHNRSFFLSVLVVVHGYYYYYYYFFLIDVILVSSTLVRRVVSFVATDAPLT